MADTAIDASPTLCTSRSASQRLVASNRRSRARSLCHNQRLASHPAVVRDK